MEWNTNFLPQQISCIVGLRIISKENKISQLILSVSARGNMFSQHSVWFPVHETKHMRAYPHLNSLRRSAEAVSGRMHLEFK